MSNIYIQEPLTSGKVLLKTSVGDIEIELWTKEAPQACRNFIQLCMEGYYNNTIFHRVVKNFIVQGGDPTGTGEGGESIYNHPFKDEFHTRLRFCRRGLVAMANAGKDDNGSQFFFTLGATPELQNKHTIFGKVAGDTIYNMIKLGEGLIDEDERPLYPQKIITTEVINNSFDDIIPRIISKSKEGNKESKKKEKTAAVKNYKLLSFGEEAEEDEEETIAINKKFAGKGKSAHDNLADPKLSSQSVIEIAESSNHSDVHIEASESEKKELTNRIKNKLLKSKTKEKPEDNLKVEDNTTLSHQLAEENLDTAELDDSEFYIGKTQHEKNKKKLEEIKKDIRDLKREVKNEKNLKILKEVETKKEQLSLSEGKKEYIESQAKYKAAKAKLPDKKSVDDFAANMLKQFKNQLHNNKCNNDRNNEEDNKDSDDDSWMKHSFQSTEEIPVLAKDASTKNDDWFEIYDPRNPLNKRRRGETTDKSKKFKK